MSVAIYSVLGAIVGIVLSFVFGGFLADFIGSLTGLPLPYVVVISIIITGAVFAIIGGTIGSLLNKKGNQ